MWLNSLLLIAFGVWGAAAVELNKRVTHIDLKYFAEKCINGPTNVFTAAIHARSAVQGAQLILDVGKDLVVPLGLISGLVGGEVKVFANGTCACAPQEDVSGKMHELMNGFSNNFFRGFGARQDESQISALQDEVLKIMLSEHPTIGDQFRTGVVTPMRQLFEKLNPILRAKKFPKKANFDKLKEVCEDSVYGVDKIVSALNTYMLGTCSIKNPYNYKPVEKVLPKYAEEQKKLTDEYKKVIGEQVKLLCQKDPKNTVCQKSKFRSADDDSPTCIPRLIVNKYAFRQTELEKYLRFINELVVQLFAITGVCSRAVPHNTEMHALTGRINRLSEVSHNIIEWRKQFENDNLKKDDAFIDTVLKEKYEEMDKIRDEVFSLLQPKHVDSELVVTVFRHDNRTYHADFKTLVHINEYLYVYHVNHRSLGLADVVVVRRAKSDAPKEDTDTVCKRLKDEVDNGRKALDNRPDFVINNRFSDEAVVLGAAIDFKTSPIQTSIKASNPKTSCPFPTTVDRNSDNTHYFLSFSVFA